MILGCTLTDSVLPSLPRNGRSGPVVRVGTSHYATVPNRNHIEKKTSIISVRAVAQLTNNQRVPWKLVILEQKAWTDYSSATIAKGEGKAASRPRHASDFRARRNITHVLVHWESCLLSTNRRLGRAGALGSAAGGGPSLPLMYRWAIKQKYN